MSSDAFERKLGPVYDALDSRNFKVCPAGGPCFALGFRK